MPSILGLEPLFRDGNGVISTTPPGPDALQYGARVTWSDTKRNTNGKTDFSITDIPQQLTTAPQVESYFNTIVAPNKDAFQTRLGVFFGCYATVSVYSYTPGVGIDMNVRISDEPIPL